MAPVAQSVIITNNEQKGGPSESVFEVDLFPVLPTASFPLNDSGEDSVVCRPMGIEDYGAVRNLIPKVSRCFQYYSKEVVSVMITLPTFFPFVLCQESSGEVVGYAELHRLPHLGRGFDGRLEKVLIVESLRGMKLAQRACSFLLETAKTTLQCGRVDLTVEKPDAKKVYGNLGFAQVDTEVWRLVF